MKPKNRMNTEATPGRTVKYSICPRAGQLGAPREDGADKLSEVLLRSTKNGVASVLFRYQKKPGPHSQMCHPGTLSG